MLYTIREPGRLAVRAAHHRKAGRFVGGLHREWRWGGAPGRDVEFSGGLMGCLATPVEIEARRLARSMDPDESFGAIELAAQLSADFGVGEGLLQLAEGFYDYMSDAERGHADFAVAFARALQPGVRVTDETAAEWALANGLAPCAWRPNRMIEYEVVDESDDPWHGDQRRKFLGWLRRGSCPLSATRLGVVIG